MRGSDQSPAATPEALRTALVHACFDPGHVIGPRDGRTTDEWRGDACMKQIAPLLADLQRATAERDEALIVAHTMREGIRDACDEATHHRNACLIAQRERDAATAEAASLRAALKAKAEEQVAYWRKRQEAEKSPEDGISEDGETYTPIGDVAAWQGGYCNGRMSEADWWLKTLQHWPNEAARAATAREG